MNFDHKIESIARVKIIEGITLKFFDDFKLKTASNHPFLKQAFHFIFLNFFLESNYRIF
jgi:hypothetical protein